MFLLFALGAQAQSSSSSTPEARSATNAQQSSSSPRAGQPEAGGSAITLETSEQLFDVAAGLNACGYDTDLANSDPIRQQIRDEMTAKVAVSAVAQRSAATLCAFVHDHELTDKARELAQYVSLALFLGPELKPTADETEMPPDALNVFSFVGPLRAFADAVGLHAIWLKHHAEYDAIIDRVHDPLTKAVLDTNVYLKVPVSSYDGRRVTILVEPLLAPSAPNARIYSSNYVIVTSPNAEGRIRMDQIRHLYLHYEIEPLVYARQGSMQRLTPLLKPVQNAPVDYVYKTDVVALLTECLIKAIEARTLDTGLTAPVKPAGSRTRPELARYDEELASYERQAEVIRRKQVELDMRQGWVMTDYFYTQLAGSERDSESLSERMGQMVYGMDVGREQKHAQQIAFLPTGTSDFVKRAPRPLTPVMQAEKLMLEGKLDDAMTLADKALADPGQNHPDALYLKSRIELMEGDPETSKAGFEEVVKTASNNPHTLAWAHVYLGRLYDIKIPAERAQAVAEYKAALGVAGVPPDARTAAEKGMKVPFAVPRVEHVEEAPLDPSGKAEKEAYRPDEARPEGKPQ